MTWTGAVNGNFNTSGNWTPAGPPTLANDVTIAGAANPANILMDNDGLMHSLSFTVPTNFLGFIGALAIDSGGIPSNPVGFTTASDVPVVLLASQAWSLTGGANTLNGNVVGPGLTLTLIGSAGIAFNGDNSNLGGIVLNGGTILANSALALGGSPFTLTLGRVDFRAPVSTPDYGTDILANGTSGIINAQTAGSRFNIGTLTVGAGDLLTLGSLTATAGTIITTTGLNLAGTIVKATGGTALWVLGPLTESPGAAVTLQGTGLNPSGAALDQGLHFAASNTMNTPVTNSGAGSTILGADSGATLTYGGALSLGGTGSLVLSPRTGGTISFAGAALTAAQPILIRGDATGTVRFGSTLTFPAVGLTVDNSILETNNGASLPTALTFLNSAAWAVRSTPHVFAGSVVVSGATTIDAVANLTLNGVLSGGGAITKSSSGTLTLAGANTHTGSITMAPNGGTLSVPGSLGAGGTISVNANDVLQVNGTVARSVAVTTGGTMTGTGSIGAGLGVSSGAGSNFTPGNGGTGALTTGDLALADTSNLNFTIGTSGTSANTGALTLDGILNITAGTGFGLGTYTLFSTSVVSSNNQLRTGTVPGGFSYIYNIVGNQVQLRVVNIATAVELANLEATTDGRATQIRWQAGTEVRNLGYRVFREEGGRRREISGGLIAGSALRARFDPLAGRDYAFVDTSAPRGATYWLEAVDTHGKRQWIGSVRARPGTLAAKWMPPSELLATSKPVAVVPSAPARVVAQFASTPEALRINAPIQRANQYRLAAASGAVKVLVRQDGVYRVSVERLVAAGFPMGAALSGIQLSSAGQSVAFRASSYDGKTLQSGDRLEFFAQAADTQFTGTAVYWVSSGLGPPTLIAAASTAEPTTTETVFTETLEARDRTRHINSLPNTDTDGFYGPAIVGTTPSDRIFSTPALAVLSAQSATLEVNLQGLSDNEHAVDVLVNGVGVGSVHSVFTDLAHAVFTLPPGTLVPGDNRVSLVGRSDAELAVEVSQRLTYARQYLFGGPQRFTADGGAQVQLIGQDADSAHVLDITNPLRPAAVTTSATQAGASLVTSGTGQRILYAYRDQDVLAPAAVVANTPSRWHEDPGADLVIIGNKALLPSLATLAGARRADGLKVATVDIEDVYDEFSAGEKDATAIRTFLQTATANWSTKPRFVLLAGAATYDPRGWLGSPELDQVPTLIIDTRALLTASDDALVTFDSTKGPALAVGRLPLSTPAEMDAAVSKILGRTLATPSSASLLLVRDRDDNINFSSASAEVRAALSGWNAQDLARGDDEAASHTALIAALRTGPAVVDYQGHGAEDFWNGSKTRLLSTDDVDALSNTGKASLLVAATCLNGYFHDIGREALAIALLRTPAGGAWGMWASSGMTFPTEHAALSEALLTAALNEGLTLGEATLKAKQAVQDVDIRATFHLFGDPSARAAPAKSPAATKPAASASGCGTPGSPSIALAAVALLALAVAARRRRPGSSGS